MKAKSRKRLLISSVAMLLVAMLALGTATFAWFTTSTQATASGISVKTIKSSELVISKSDLDWKTTVNYEHSSESYTPVSTIDGVSWFEANAERRDNFAKKSTDNFAPVTSATNHYYTEALNIGNKGDAKVEHITITVSGLDCNYARLAIFRATENNSATHNTTTETFAECIYDTDGAKYNAAKSTTETQEITPTNGTISIAVPDLNGKTGTATIGDVVYYKFYIWFEGQDEQCTDVNAGTSFGDIKFTVSGSTAAS